MKICTILKFKKKSSKFGTLLDEKNIYFKFKLKIQ